MILTILSPSSKFGICSLQVGKNSDVVYVINVKGEQWTEKKGRTRTDPWGNASSDILPVRFQITGVNDVLSVSKVRSNPINTDFRRTKPL